MFWFALVSALSPAEASIPAAYGVVKHRSTETVVQGTPAMLTIKAAEANVALVVQCKAGDQTLQWETDEVPMGEERSFALLFDDPKVRSAECGIFARMANGLAEKKAVTVSWTVVPPKDTPVKDENGEDTSPKAEENAE